MPATKKALKARFRETVSAAEKAVNAIKERVTGSSELTPVRFREGRRRRYLGRTASLDAIRVAFDRLQGGNRKEDKRDLAFEISKSLGVPMHEGLEEVEKLIADRFLVEDQGLLRLIPVEFRERQRERYLGRTARLDSMKIAFDRLQGGDLTEQAGNKRDLAFEISKGIGIPMQAALDEVEKMIADGFLVEDRGLVWLIQFADVTSRMGSRMFSERHTYRSSSRARADVATALRRAGGFSDRLTLAIEAGKVSGVGQRAAEEAIEDMIQEGELEIAAGSLVSFGSLMLVGFRERKRRRTYDQVGRLASDGKRRKRYDAREDAEEIIRILVDLVGESGLEDFADGIQGISRWISDVQRRMGNRWNGEVWHLAIDMIRDRYKQYGQATRLEDADPIDLRNAVSAARDLESALSETKWADTAFSFRLALESRNESKAFEHFSRLNNAPIPSRARGLLERASINAGMFTSFSGSSRRKKNYATPSYRSGNPRVHGSTPETMINAAIEEYERRANDGSLPADLASDLLETARDLREELEIRVDEKRLRLR